VVRENLQWAHTHSDLIVRHLLMPGHAACCWRPVAEWLAENLPGVKVNLRAGFWPAWQRAAAWGISERDFLIAGRKTILPLGWRASWD
jgi:uncharacterized Fe-S radical SAM superfamily protein PflX